eukprot:g19825.t1
MGRFRGATFLIVGGFAPSFVPLVSSSYRSYRLPSGQSARAQDGPSTFPGAGVPLALVGTAALMAVARTTQVARRAEEAKASKASKPAAKEPKEAVEASAAKEPSAAEATSDPVEDSEPAKPVGFDITKQIGATPPLGFWDPAKLCKSEQQFRESPGDFGDPLGIAEKVGKYDDEWRNREVNNGRFAMFAAMGIIVAENETGMNGGCFEGALCEINTQKMDYGWYGLAGVFAILLVIASTFGFIVIFDLLTQLYASEVLLWILFVLGSLLLAKVLATVVHLIATCWKIRQYRALIQTAVHDQDGDGQV